MCLCPVAHTSLVRRSCEVFVILSHEYCCCIPPAYEIEIALAFAHEFEVTLSLDVLESSIDCLSRNGSLVNFIQPGCRFACAIAGYNEFSGIEKSLSIAVVTYVVAECAV